LPFDERLQYNYADFIESDKSILLRFTSALQEIARTHQGKTVLIATHAGDIRVILMHLGYAHYLGSGSIANAGYVELTYNGNDFHIKKVVGVDKQNIRAH
jgi:broad specificity phosphatase PhoE